MLIAPVCVNPVLPNLSQLPWWRTGDCNWGIFLSGHTRSLGSAIVLILQLDQLQRPAGFCNILCFEELTLKQRQWPQGSWVVLSSNRVRETCRTSNRNMQSQIWHSQTLRTLWFPCCTAPAPKPILPLLKLETPISILKTGLVSVFFSVPLLGERCQLKVLFSVVYSWSP